MICSRLVVPPPSFRFSAPNCERAVCVQLLKSTKANFFWDNKSKEHFFRYRDPAGSSDDAAQHLGTVRTPQKTVFSFVFLDSLRCVL
jgi:hypothetical protein